MSEMATEMFPPLREKPGELIPVNEKVRTSMVESGIFEEYLRDRKRLGRLASLERGPPPHAVSSPTLSLSSDDVVDDNDDNKALLLTPELRKSSVKWTPWGEGKVQGLTVSTQVANSSKQLSSSSSSSSKNTPPPPQQQQSPLYDLVAEPLMMRTSLGCSNTSGNEGRQNPNRPGGGKGYSEGGAGGVRAEDGRRHSPPPRRIRDAAAGLTSQRWQRPCHPATAVNL